MRFVSSTELVAFIPASDVTVAETSQIMVASPPPGGGSSGPMTFTADP